VADERKYLFRLAYRTVYRVNAGYHRRAKEILMRTSTTRTSTVKTCHGALLVGSLIVAALACCLAEAGELAPLLDSQDLQSVIAGLENGIPRLMEEAHIPGLDIAVIRGGTIAWHKGFGVKNAESQVPVTKETIFEAASLTKPFFAYYVMMLADQGLLDLDKPLFTYLPVEAVEEFLGHPLDQPDFHRDWLEKITARHVLSHSSGMPHGEGGTAFPLFFEPGTQWKYSATGYGFLQNVVETLKGDKLENLMQKEVLDPLGMTRSSMVWREDYENTMANGHSFFGKPEDFRKRTEAHAAASLYTTAEDYAKFVCAVLNGSLIGPRTLREMLTPQVDMSAGKPPADAARYEGLGWSLGFGTQDDANGRAFWQWGDYGIFRSYVIAYPGTGSGVVYLTNSHNGLSICGDLVAGAVGGQVSGSRALNWRPFDSLVYQLGWEFKTSGPRAMEMLPELTREHPGELSWDDVAYLSYVLQGDEMTPEVIALLDYWVKEHPGSGAARLELAKAYAGAEDLDLARTHLEKAREAVEDTVETRIIDWNLDYVRAVTTPFQASEEHLQRLAGDYGPRHFQVTDGVLLYKRDGGGYADYLPLLALSRDTFLIKGAPYFRMKFEFDENGDPVKVIGIYEQGAQDESARTK
jgi:CubicO group peptidase (beta-lactamase class C family)